MFEILHQFWVDMFPMFSGYEFIYVFLDFASIYVFLELFLVLPSMLLFGGHKRLWND